MGRMDQTEQSTLADRGRKSVSRQAAFVHVPPLPSSSPQQPSYVDMPCPSCRQAGGLHFHHYYRLPVCQDGVWFWFGTHWPAHCGPEHNSLWWKKMMDVTKQTFVKKIGSGWVGIAARIAYAMRFACAFVDSSSMLFMEKELLYLLYLDMVEGQGTGSSFCPSPLSLIYKLSSHYTYGSFSVGMINKQKAGHVYTARNGGHHGSLKALRGHF